MKHMQIMRKYLNILSLNKILLKVEIALKVNICMACSIVCGKRFFKKHKKVKNNLGSYLPSKKKY